ncbi:MAG: TAXI family TRAP transporter solute-binding subunit, partial [Synergistaceae bacterium]
MKKGFIYAVVTLMAVLTISSVASAATYMSIATGGTAGTYYAVGGALAAAVTKDGKLRCTAETGNASVANINLVSRKEIEIAFVQNDITYWALNGQLMFKDKPLKNIRVVASLYPEHVQMVVTKEANIKKFTDLKGKRVSVGAQGSGVWGDLQALLALSGISEKDFKKTDYLDF